MEGQEGKAQPPVYEVVSESVIKKILGDYNPKLSLIDYEAVLGSNAGDNYMSIMYKVDVKAKDEENGKVEEIHIMLKTLPRNEIRQKMINDMGAFEKESKLFSRIAPDMLKFQKQQGIPEDEIFDKFPKCYSIFHDGLTDYIAMENLQYRNYKMADRVQQLDKDHCIMVLKQMAYWHALSYAMFKGDAKAICDKYGDIKEKMIVMPEDMQDTSKMFFRMSLNHSTEGLRASGLEEEAKKLENMVNSDDIFVHLHNLLTEPSWLVINHGDCWTNNLLFQYDDNGKLMDMKFIDFQMMRISSRAIDINYFMYTSARAVVFDNDETLLLKTYHEEFIKRAEQLGVDTSKEGFTFSALEEEFDKRRFYGYLMGLMLIPMLQANSSDVPDMDSLEEKDLTEEAGKEFIKSFQNDKANKMIATLTKKHISKIRQFNSK